MFAFGLDLEECGDGFEQTLSLAWFDELKLRAAIPGCAPVELHCDDRGRCQARGGNAAEGTPVFTPASLRGSAAKRRDGKRPDGRCRQNESHSQEVRSITASAGGSSGR